MCHTFPQLAPYSHITLDNEWEGRWVYGASVVSEAVVAHTLHLAASLTRVHARSTCARTLGVTDSASGNAASTVTNERLVRVWVVVALFRFSTTGGTGREMTCVARVRAVATFARIALRTCPHVHTCSTNEALAIFASHAAISVPVIAWTT